MISHNTHPQGILRGCVFETLVAGAAPDEVRQGDDKEEEEGYTRGPSTEA